MDHRAGRRARSPLISTNNVFVSTGLVRHACMHGGWVPLSVYLAVELELSATQLLLLGTAIELSIVLGEIPTGVLADTFSRKWSVVIGTAILGAAQLSSGIVDRFELFLVTQFVWGFGWTFLSGAEVAWFTGEIGSVDAAEPWILRRGRWQFGALIVGIIVFGGLGLLAAPQTAVIVAGSLMLVWAALLAVSMSETAFEPVASQRLAAARETFGHGLSHVRRSRALLVLAAVLLVAAIAAEGVDRTDVRRLGDLGLDTVTTAVVVITAVAIGKAALGWILLSVFREQFAGSTLVRGLGYVFGAVALGALALAHVPILAAAAVLLVVQGGLLGATDPLIVAWTNSLTPDRERATVHSIVGQVRALGEVSGGLLLGTVAGLFTLPIALTCAAALFGLAAAMIAGLS